VTLVTTRRALRAYLVTATLSRSATESAGPAVLVGTIATVGSATSGSYVVASLTASAAVAGPVVGALIDRARSPRLGFAAAMLVMAIGLSVIAFLLGDVPLWWIMAIAVVAGLGYPALTGAWSAQIPKLVSPGTLTRAYSADAVTYSLAAVVAPPAATALVGVAATAPIWLAVVVLAIAAVTLRAVPLPRREAVGTRPHLVHDLRDGLVAMLRRAGLRRSTVITTVGFAGQAAVFVAAPVLATELGQSLGFTGFILGSFAIGGVTTAAWFARRPVQRPDRAIIVSTLLSGLALMAIGLAPTPALLLLAAFAMGATEPPLVSAMFQVRVRESPSHVQAQVFSTSASLRMTAFAVATAACGWLVGGPGIAAAIAFGVALHVIALAAGLLTGPSLPKREKWLRRR
jgi:predicted MFS family arabinose efflux permease